jgi:hypothetical protein
MTMIPARIACGIIPDCDAFDDIPIDWKRDDPVFVEGVEVAVLKKDIFYLYYFV